VHEDRLKTVFPSRLTKHGQQVVEIALADGEQSKVA
jgi:N-acyl homoserine lactone hydrolase